METNTAELLQKLRSIDEALQEREALLARRAKAGELAGELLNPLETISNLVYLARTEPSASGQVVEFLEQAEFELGRLARISVDLLHHTLDSHHVRRSRFMTDPQDSLH